MIQSTYGQIHQKTTLGDFSVNLGCKKYIMRIILFIFFLYTQTAFARPVTITKPVLELNILRSFFASHADLGELARHHHLNSPHCGGFVASFEGEVFDNPSPAIAGAFLNYSIARRDLVKSLMRQVSEPRLLSNILWFSSYQTRFYLSESGIKAMQDLKLKWAQLVGHLSFATVELVQHKDFKQPSVILTLKGSTNDVIVVGGHGDSINKDDNEINAISPGADDNASGISVITEVIQILAQNEFRPKNTIKFMAYAAEEVGLLGSMEISGLYKDQAVNVLGVIQFDGTNFRGSKDLAMVLIKDHTNQEQNKFLGSLIDTYLRVPWRYDTCGYACSDSYSWTYRGFPASFPVEARIKQENSHIHSAQDTLDVSNNSVAHSVNFAKLGIAYVVELDK
jgi:leucyl aminopeptidase